MTNLNYSLVSIITVVYNNVKGIKETIQSVINQTYKNIEFIIIDGKSNDGTLDVINKYKDNINIFISESDKGIYDAMNKGINLASGDYIIFMNSGDIFYDNKVLSTIFKNRNNSDVIYGDHCQDFGSYKTIIKAKYPSKREPMTFCHQSVFVKSNLLKKNKFNLQYKICSDRDLFIRIFNQNVKYRYYDIVVSRIEAFGASNENRIATVKEMNKIYSCYNIQNGIKRNLNIIKAYSISLIEFLVGKKTLNNIRRLKNRKLEI
jgi:glycosyltransferase involved in cell wall biosynthesis